MISSNILISFAIDLAAILLFAGGFYYSRYKRRDLFVTFTFFNIAMFVIVTLISNSNLGIGASFGLFALLAIIRLRSEEFSNLEVGYFFGCLTLAIVNGIGLKNHWLLAFMNLVILVAIGILDHPQVLKGVQHSKVSLDAVYTDDAELRQALSILLNAKILNFSVTRVNNVNDTTNVSVEYRKNPEPAIKDGQISHSKVSLDAVYNDDAKLVKVLTKLLNATILDYTITKIDNVRDITNLSVVYKKPNAKLTTEERSKV
jgi:hypothetical protein